MGHGRPVMFFLGYPWLRVLICSQLQGTDLLCRGTSCTDLGIDYQAGWQECSASRSRRSNWGLTLAYRPCGCHVSIKIQSARDDRGRVWIYAEGEDPAARVALFNPVSPYAPCGCIVEHTPPYSVCWLLAAGCWLLLFKKGEYTQPVQA